MGDINMEALFYDYNGAYDLSKMSFKAQVVNDKDEVFMQAEVPNITQKMSVSFSSDNLKMGDYYIQGILTDQQTGEIVSKKEWKLRKREKDYRPAVYLDEYNRLIKDGNPHFLMQMYNSSAYDDFVEDVIGTPIKTMSHYGFGWWLNGDKYTEMLKKMRNNGLQIRLTLLTFVYSNLSQKEARELVTEQADIRPLVESIIKKYKDDPVLQGYYLFDEANPIRYGEEIRWLNEICANADIDRPTVGVTDNMYRYGIFTKSVDIMGVDPYPIKGTGSDDIAQVGRYVRQIKEDFPNRPVFVVLQGFHWKSNAAYIRPPSEEELRNTMIQAICEGAQGLEWFSYREIKNDTEKPFSQWWREAITLYKEAEMFSPIILSVEPAPHYEVKGGGDWLNITSRRHEGKSYIFTANNIKDYNSAILKVEGAKSVKELYSGQTYKVDDEGWFEVDFNPLGINVFEIEQDDYLSPEAELLSFGITGNKNSYIVYDNGDEIQLNISNETTMVSYGAKISDKAKLFINGGESELAGEISLDGIEEITVRVVSEDSRFYTERVYRINRL
ncbi:MAG: hypothetical protein GX800_07755 [Clostridiaceae bacterium]|nr:hypothetical protein [Clostridiaceae bacterium]